MVARSAADASARARAPKLLALTEIYASGRSDGFRDGRSREYRQAVKRGYDEGFGDGRRAAVRSLRRRYLRKGYEAGAADALGGFGEWRGGFYIVSVAPGRRAGDYRLQSRLGPIEPGASYALCGDRSKVCTRARAGRRPRSR
jgi:hypothetical protein